MPTVDPEKGFPTGRKFHPKITKFCPKWREFRTNLLDNIPCLCASLKGEGGAEEQAGPRKRMAFSTICMNTQGVKPILEIFTNSYHTHGKAFMRLAGERKKGAPKMKVFPTMCMKTRGGILGRAAFPRFV